MQAIGVYGARSLRLLPDRSRLVMVGLFFCTLDYRFNIPGLPGLAVAEIFMLIALAVLYADAVILPREVVQKLTAAVKENPWVFVYFGWAFVTVLIGFTRSADNLFAFRNLLPSLVIYFLAVTYLVDGKKVRLALASVVMGACVNMALGAVQKVLGKPYPNALHEGAFIKMDLAGNFVTNTPSGFFVHPNGLAVFLLPIVLILVAGVYRGLFAGGWARTVSFLLLAASGAMLWLTFTKGAILWVLVGIGLLALPRRLQGSVFGIGVLAIVVVIAAAVIAGMQSHGVEFRTINSMMTRMQIWDSAFAAMVHDKYILAFGNGFREIYFQSLRFSELPYLNAHNNLLNQIVFFGIPALLIHLTIVLKVMMRLGSAVRQSTDEPAKTLQLLMLACLAALFGEHFFEPTLDSVALQVQYHVFLALGMVVSRKGFIAQAQAE